MHKDKVTVIGGAGFLGSHVADELSSKGLNVTIFDHKVSPWAGKDQRVVVGNILDKEAVFRAIEGSRYVFHYAGLADIEEAGERPLDAIESNIMGTSIILDACVRANVEKFIFASTMYVYSDQGGFYRVSKQAAEGIVAAFEEKFGLNYVILRYGSLYGNRSQSWNGLRKFVEQALKKGRIDFNGNGKERREYIHVRDAARLAVRVLRPEYRNECLMITGTQVLNSRELFSMIEEIVGRPIEIKLKEGAPEHNRYVLTPYRYTPRSARKIVPDEFIDIGQGILDLVEEICNNDDQQENVFGTINPRVKTFRNGEVGF